MERTVLLGAFPLTYTLTYKKVKNVNIRILPGGQVRVSAGRISAKEVDELLRRRAAWILPRLNRAKKPGPDVSALEQFTAKEKKQRITAAVTRVLPRFSPWNVTMPEVTVRRMTSRWGSCSVQRGRITMNELLLLAPEECLEYVAAHELAHFVQPNHSARFYEVLGSAMPDHEHRRELLRRQEIL